VRKKLNVIEFAVDVIVFVVVAVVDVIVLNVFRVLVSCVIINLNE